MKDGSGNEHEEVVFRREKGALAHIPCWLLYVGSFSYTSRAGFFMWIFFFYMSHAGLFMLGAYLTHPVLAA